jgi:CRISPR-associated protein Cas6/Cse3/CasE subtype I-E
MSGGSNRLCDIPLIMPKGFPDNPYEVHERLYSQFCVNGVRGFLFSMEGDVAPIVLVRSRNFPDALASAAEPVDLPGVGERRLFRLTASPTVSRNGKKTRLPPGDRPARVAWLARRSDEYGFELVGEPTVIWRSVKLVRQGKPIIRESARFEGMLQVTNAERLETALEHGIGRSHAFGFGLLRLFRAN